MKRTIKLALALGLCLSPAFASIISFPGNSTTLASGEIFTIGPASFTVSTVPTSVLVPISIDATASTASNNSNFNLPIVFSVDGGATATLTLRGTWTLPTGSTFRVLTTFGTSMFAISPNSAVDIGYPVRITQDGAAGEVRGNLGSIGTRDLLIRQSIAAPEPGTFLLAGMILTMFPIVRRGSRK